MPRHLDHPLRLPLGRDDHGDEFTAAIERLTHRRVVAFLSANQTTPGVACELFFLNAAPLATEANAGV